jgi:hypothetical protein
MASLSTAILGLLRVWVTGGVAHTTQLCYKRKPKFVQKKIKIKNKFIFFKNKNTDWYNMNVIR